MQNKGTHLDIPEIFDSFTQKSSRLLFIGTIMVYPWILCDALWASIQGWKNIGAQAIMPEQLIFRIHVMKVETPVSCTDQSARDEKWGLINDLILPSWYAASQNEQTLCRRQTSFFDEWEAKRLLAAKQIEMHYSTTS